MPTEAESAFLMTFAHDLRQPLRSILMSAQRIQHSSDQLSDGLRAKLDDIIAAARRQDELIASVVEYDQALMPPAAAEKPLALRLAIQTACMRVEPFRQTSKGAIQFEAHRTPKAFAPSGIARVVEKLLHNSLKFHVHGTAPAVSVEASEGAAGLIDVRVSDNGLGIESQYRETVFEPFKRLNPASAFPGSGLGLSICRRLMEAIRGTIHVEDGGPGQGVSMVVSFRGLEGGA